MMPYCRDKQAARSVSLLYQYRIGRQSVCCNPSTSTQAAEFQPWRLCHPAILLHSCDAAILHPKAATQTEQNCRGTYVCPELEDDVLTDSKMNRQQQMAAIGFVSTRHNEFPRHSPAGATVINLSCCAAAMETPPQDYACSAAMPAMPHNCCMRRA